jgi:hypothetical protein
MDSHLHQRIRNRAYEIWGASGHMHGQAEQHWLAAEREVLEEMAAPLTAAAGLVRATRVQRKVANQRRKGA